MHSLFKFMHKQEPETKEETIETPIERNDELYCDNRPFDKLLNETSESDDNVVEPIVKVVFIQLPPLNCKT